MRSDRTVRGVAVLAAATLGGAVVAVASDDRPVQAAPDAHVLAATGAPSGPTISHPGPPAPPGPVRPSPATRPATVPPTTAAAAPPTSVRIPSLGIDLPVVPVGTEPSGVMTVPEAPGTAGWYWYGSAPGSARGATVVVAHVDTEDGLGPMARLPRLDPGGEIVVETSDGPRRYELVRVGRVAKDDLDLDALFSRSGPARLHVVTCGGDFDEASGSYEDNVVAVADPVGA